MEIYAWEVQVKPRKYEVGATVKLLLMGSYENQAIPLGNGRRTKNPPSLGVGTCQKSISLIFFFITLFFFDAVPLFAQVGMSSSLTAEQVYGEDIRTSSFMELAAWCRSLGLSEGGTKEELARRLHAYYNLSESTPEGDSDAKLIVIESARTTEYFSLDVVDEDYARLRGGVTISLRDGDTVHRISAGEILYNRTRNIMTASGGVEYIKELGDTIETFKGESITVDMDNWSSVFMDGLTEKSMSDSVSVYQFAGTVISRSDEEVTIMNDAIISNAKNPEAYWSLNASKLWLLPGSDWAIFNAVLKVGEIPVLWIPGFYFPADEVVFHPVIGYRSRWGNFAQTTTYIWGRPKASSSNESSISKIMGSGQDMERVQEGLFLRSTGKKAIDPNDKRLSVLFDAYANLGFYAGTELVLPKSKNGLFNGMDLSAGIGFTRNVYKVSYGYSPFAQYDGSSEWNKSYFFSTELPFRYRLDTKGSFSFSKYGTLSWAFPFYSDAYVNYDFTDRSEIMDWVQMLKGNPEESTTVSSTTIGEHSWRLNGSLTPQVSALSPFVSSLSLSSISSSIIFKPRNSLKQNSVSPERIFFFPDKFTLYSISGAVSGTPLTLGISSSSATNTSAEPETDPRLATIRPPWETPTAESKNAATSTPQGLDLSPPALSQRFNLPKSGGPKFALDYEIRPSFVSETQFRSSQTNWPEKEDIDWSELSSTFSRATATGSIGLTLSQPETSLYSSIFRVSTSATKEEYTYINEESEEFDTQDKIDTANLRRYNASFVTLNYDWTSTLKPFFRSDVWGATTFQYAVKGLLGKNAFNGTATDPSWEWKAGEWTKDDLTANTVSANLAASVLDKNQNLTLSAILPPEDWNFSANAIFRIWRTETNLRGSLTEEKINPFYITETLKLGASDQIKFEQQITWDPELEEYTNLATSFTWGGFAASFAASRSKSYDFNPSIGWVLSSDEEKLNPSSLKFSYNQTLKKTEFWDKQLSFSIGINSSLNFDLQRYTYSSLNFGFSFTLGISKFLDIELSSTSSNSVIYRYFQELDLPLFPLDIGDAQGETNFFIDLFNSFRFDDESLRRSSGFKLKSFKLKLIHHLGDWDASLGITLTPYLDTNTKYYKFNNEISFLVQWIPITEIKTELAMNKDVWTMK